MGKVWLDSAQIGTFNPQTVGTSGSILLNSTNIGTFTLALSGYVYVNSTIVGSYWAKSTEPPPPSPLQDARSRIKVYLETYLSPSMITNDDGSPVTFAVIYANPNYPIQLEFLTVALLFCIDTPDSVALPVGVGYIENVPITIWCIDKTGITGTKLRWKAEAELRRVVEEHPAGWSLYTWQRLSDNEQNLGSTILYSVEYVLRYKRYVP